MASNLYKYFLSLFFLFYQTVLLSETLDEIIVSGDWREIEQNRKESSLEVFNENFLEKRKIKHFEDLTYSIPNLNFAASDSRPRYFQIRGIGERSGYEGTPNSSVGFLIDDIDFSGQGGIASSYDIQQVEVYRGPQGARMGANSLAGMIYIKTNDPVDRYQAEANLTIGDYGRKDLGGVINVPVSDNLKYRLSVKKENVDGFRNNLYLNKSDTSRKDEQSYRLKLKWEPNKKSELNFVHFGHDFDDPADIWTIDNSLNTLSDRPGMDAQDSNAYGLKYLNSLTFGELQLLYSRTDSDIIFSYDADWGNPLSHQPYIYDYFSETLRNRKTSNMELRLLSNNSNVTNSVFEWIAGISIFEIDEDNSKSDDGAYGDPFDGYETFYSSSFFSSDFSSKSKSLFGNLDYLFSNKSKLSFGYRWEDWKADYLDSNSESFNPSNNMNGGKISYINNPDSATTYFLSIAKGYKQGGFNLGTGFNDSKFSNSINYDPETLINYEIGLNKYLTNFDTFFDLVFFYSDRKDQQVLISTQVDPQDPNTFLYLTKNAAEGKNYGAEFSLKTELTEALDAYIDIGILKTEIRNYESRKDLEGRDQAHAPSYSFAGGINWKLTDQLELLLDINGKNSFYYSDSHDNESDSYVLTNLNLIYQNQKITYNFWIRNIFDEYYSVRGFYFGNEPPNFEDTLYERHGDPRNLGLTITYNFE